MSDDLCEVCNKKIEGSSHLRGMHRYCFEGLVYAADANLIRDALAGEVNLTATVKADRSGFECMVCDDYGVGACGHGSTPIEAMFQGVANKLHQICKNVQRHKEIHQ